MVKRSIASVIYAVLASIVTFATYYLLLTTRDSAEIQKTLNELGAQVPAVKGMLEASINSVCTTFLVLGIVTLALAILARYFKVANVLLNLLAWFYFFFGIIVLCLPQFILCLRAVVRNKKYFKKADYVKRSAAYAEQNTENAYAEEYAAPATEADDVADEIADEITDELTDGELDTDELSDDGNDIPAAAAIEDESAKPKKASKPVIKKTRSIRNIFNPAYSVVLKSGDSENKKILKMIRKSTGFSKKQANQYVENMPVFVKLDAPKRAAKKAYKKLTKLGCEAEIVR